jgi:SLOG cluster3 family
MKKPIFLSASVPVREPFVNYSDAIAIREAVLALVAVTVRERELVFGGHPAISPLVEHAARSLGALGHVHIYQSKFFEELIPPVAKEFPNLHWTDLAGSGGGSQEASLELMRREMIGSRDYGAAVFIGGMEGIFDEIRIFKQLHPERMIIPVASTGGAAKNLIERGEGPPDEELLETLKTENRYRRLFMELLPQD